MTSNCHEQMTFQQLYASIFLLSTWCASLSAQPLLRWSYALDASESANEATSLTMRRAAKRSKEQVKSKAAAFCGQRFAQRAQSNARKLAMAGQGACPLRFLGVPKGAVLSQRIAPFCESHRVSGARGAVTLQILPLLRHRENIRMHFAPSGAGGIRSAVCSTCPLKTSTFADDRSAGQDDARWGTGVRDIAAYM